MPSKKRLFSIRLPDEQAKIIDKLVQTKIFASKTRVFETFVQEGLDKRGLINYMEILSKRTDQVSDHDLSTLSGSGINSK